MVAVIWLVAGAIWAFVLFWPSPRDSTDSPDQRSGMRPHTDALTGCQYLSSFGGLTPRLDGSGKHMCEGPR